MMGHRVQGTGHEEAWIDLTRADQQIAPDNSIEGSKEEATRGRPRFVHIVCDD